MYVVRSDYGVALAAAASASYRVHADRRRRFVLFCFAFFVFVSLGFRVFALKHFWNSLYRKQLYFLPLPILPITLCLRKRSSEIDY